MTEPRDDLFRQLERYGTLLDDAAVHAGTRPARDVTRSARTLRPIRSRLVPALAAAAVVMGGATTVAVVRNFLAPPDRVAHTTSPSTGPSAFAGDVFPSELRVTAALPAGTSAWRGMAFDGAFMWVANAGNDTVSKR